MENRKRWDGGWRATKGNVLDRILFRQREQIAKMKAGMEGENYARGRGGLAAAETQSKDNSENKLFKKQGNGKRVKGNKGRRQKERQTVIVANGPRATEDKESKGDRQQ